MAQAFQEIYQEFEKKGVKKGEKIAEKRLVRNMIKKGKSVEEIADITDINITEVIKIKNTID